MGPGTELVEVCTLTDGEPLAPKMATALLLSLLASPLGQMSSAQDES